MSPGFTRLFDRHAVAAFARQHHFLAVVGEMDWSFDLQTGRLSFGDRYTWPAQLLGTESDATRTWLWAWANPTADLPGSIVRAANLVREVGRFCGALELTTPQVPLDDLGELGGHALALVGSGVWPADAYYRAPYEGGAAYLLVKAADMPAPGGSPLARTATVFPQAIATLPLTDHREALLGYLAGCGIAAVCEGPRLTVAAAGDGPPDLTAEFDALARLTRLELTMTGESRPDA